MNYHDHIGNMIARCSQAQPVSAPPVSAPPMSEGNRRRIAAIEEAMSIAGKGYSPTHPGHARLAAALTDELPHIRLGPGGDCVTDIYLGGGR